MRLPIAFAVLLFLVTPVSAINSSGWKCVPSSIKCLPDSAMVCSANGAGWEPCGAECMKACPSLTPDTYVSEYVTTMYRNLTQWNEGFGILGRIYSSVSRMSDDWIHGAVDAAVLAAIILAIVVYWKRLEG